MYHSLRDIIIAVAGMNNPHFSYWPSAIYVVSLAAAIIWIIPALIWAVTASMMSNVFPLLSQNRFLGPLFGLMCSLPNLLLAFAVFHPFDFDAAHVDYRMPIGFVLALGGLFSGTALSFCSR